MNYQSYETIRKERDLGMPFYDPRNDIVVAVDTSIEQVTFNSHPKIDGEDATALNKIIETIMNAYSDLETWQMLPFIFGGTISEHPYVMPSLNLQEYISMELEGMISEARGHGLQGAWIEKKEGDSLVNQRTNSTVATLNRRWKNIEQITGDARTDLVIDSFVLIDIDISPYVVGDAFDSLLVFSNLLDKYIKSEPFNVGEVTTLDARAEVGVGTVFGWKMMFEQSEV